MSLEKIGKKEDFREGLGKLVRIKGKEIAVFRIKDEFYAIDNECSHEGGPLCEGEVEDHKVICPWHGAEFDLKSGKVLRLPATKDLKTYRVILKGEEVFLDV